MFIVGIYVVIVAGLTRSHPAAGSGVHPYTIPKAAAAVGILLLLKAFAAGSSALTGVEAIANDVPAFREPRARRAMRTEVMLGSLLGTMLLGLAVLTVRFHIGPSSDQTVLSQITGASVGPGHRLLRRRPRHHRDPGPGRQYLFRRAPGTGQPSGP